MAETTLITIHGFWSSSATWDRLTTLWSADERMQEVQIHPFGYGSPKKPRTPFSPSRIPDYDDIAQTFATEYMVKLAEAGSVAIVTHSQGGLIMQRFLTWMVQQGRARELSRIVSVVMIACPNNGSDYLRSLRHALGYRRHAQAGSLEMLDKRVADTQRTVLQRIVNATGVDDHQCRIPLHVYAGDSDRVVRAASAQAAFPGASTLAGNHFSILDPEAPGNSTADTVRHHVLEDLQASGAANAALEKQLPGTGNREDGTPVPTSPPSSSSTERSGPERVEGPFAQTGDVNLDGKYVAGHDMTFGRVEGDQNKRQP
ncbi:alpha/beta fold hydrolase [Actinomadura latina]|uniref:Alpha/beta fold hydrolase n=1 Tax=Actinomadura latina TaxID=163603 RepID=A0A846Z4H6_9ACTN|nr:alpha/beta fold hydrolase [Actinomadura latina]NKZ06132.1 alpha/beta fold hydrolase [Actinomadura latina]